MEKRRDRWFVFWNISRWDAIDRLSSRGTIQKYDHIHRPLDRLCPFGVNRNQYGEDEVCSTDGNELAVKEMLGLAVATSIDALAVGITFAFLHVDIVPAVTFIGVTTFVISAAGVKIGNLFGSRYKTKAEFAGGVILILMGLKILLEHLGILG